MLSSPMLAVRQIECLGVQRHELETLQTVVDNVWIDLFVNILQRGMFLMSFAALHHTTMSS